MENADDVKIKDIEIKTNLFIIVPYYNNSILAHYLHTEIDARPLVFEDVSPEIVVVASSV